MLLSQLRRSDDARLSYAEVAGAGGEPTLLVRERVLRYGKDDDYEPPGCERGCVPNLDYEARRSEGLVGVACPHEHTCWGGWRWAARSEVESLRCSSGAVFAALGSRNGLQPIACAIPPPFVGVGMLHRRGLSVSVVWLRSVRPGFEQLCRGLRAELGSDALIVLVARDPRVPFKADDRIAVLEASVDARGDLGLTRALEELTPDYRARVVGDPMLDLDYVRLRFATEPDVRHLLEINGHPFGGFRRSNVKFLRLLLLAAARKQGDDGGWIDKSRLLDGDDKDRALERIREDLVKYDVPGLSEEERRALVRSHKGKLRLGVPAENIELDASLAELTFVNETPAKKDGTAAKRTLKHDEGRQTATMLLRSCRRLGAPGELEAVPIPAKKRPSSRSAT